MRKDGGEQRAFGRRRCYLIVCVIGGAAAGRMLWSLPPALPHPHPSPRCQCARTRAAFYFFFLVFLFHLLPTPASFLSPFLPSFVLSFLRRKASLSVFTADLDLNVHTIKARGECQEWGWLSTLGPRGPAKEGATDRAGRPPQTSAQRLRA
ncbi:uncharacterized protein LOC104652796 [Saimiri boliviensis]|uniref:uncharacterized protein LOC104652796 n=1 Tax=Saimiri boliviensis TaxID=27679 RepID=UPI000533FDDB|nr:uncharacterized protein LOC104652796 [Saimiri boliviensis boliviensis]